MKRIRIIALLLILAFITVTAAADTFGIISYDQMMVFLKLRKPSFADAELSVHFIDVGQGDSTLIISGDNTVLIDAGEKDSGDDVAAYIRSQNIHDIDYVIASHPHSDHIGGLPEILSEFEIGHIIMPDVPDSIEEETTALTDFIDCAEKNGAEISLAYPGEILDLGISELEIIAPCSDYDNLNNYSVAALLTHKDNIFLFTGDAEEESEADILSSGRLKDVDVLKAGHHGSSTSSGGEFLEIASPEYAVISCGTGNSYNHPSEKTMKKLSEKTERIFRTDIHGSIIAESDGSTLNFIITGKKEQMR